MKSAEEPEGKGGCLVCCAREVLCAKCINRATEPTRKELKKLKRRRDALYERLSSGVQAQATRYHNEAERQACLTQLHNLSKRTSAASDKKKQLQARINSLRERNKIRQERIDNAAAQLLEHRRKQLEVSLPNQYRSREVCYMLVAAELEQEQSMLIRQLLQFFPISIKALKGDSSAPVRVAFGDQKLPLRVADLWSKSKECSKLRLSSNLGAPLGYILRLVELLSYYTGGPLLHCSSFQCSTSSIWQPQTFRNRDPPPLQSKLHLYLPSHSDSLSQSRFSETPGSPSRYQSLEAGLQLLYRTIGAYSHSKLGPLGDHLPEDWGPAAWLAWMCSQVNGKLPQATWLGKVSVLKKGEVDSQGNTGEWAEEPESPAASNFEPEKLQEVGEEIDDEDWYHVARTQLPPTPSEVHALQLYEQALGMDTGTIHRQDIQNYSWPLLGRLWTSIPYR